MTPEKLIEKILAGDYSSDEFWQLYGHFYKGYPIENIVPLLESENLDAQSAAAHLANELGSVLKGYGKQLGKILKHPSAQVRSDAIHGLRECVDWDDTDTLAEIVFALDDPDPFVHRAAMFFILCHRGNFAIRAAAAKAPGTIYQELAEMMPSWRQSVSPELITKLIKHSNPIARRFGVGLACRTKPVIDAELLDIAIECDDEEGKRMVEGIRERPKPIMSKIGYIEEDYGPCSSSFRLGECIATIVGRKISPNIKRLMARKAGRFYPLDLIFDDPELNFPEMEICWTDHAVGADSEDPTIVVILQDVPEFKFTQAYVHLGAL